MKTKVYTVAIIGVGARGGNAYGKLICKHPDKYKITHLCDIREDRLESFGNLFDVPKANRFSDDNEFLREKRADILLIATPDTLHVRHCLSAFELGYDVLCEKPLSDKAEDCLALLEAQKKHGNKALVCHVLRYSPTYIKLAEIIDSGAIGQLISIDWIEPVGYWHQAHSYVRGNWRNTEISAPMILAKSCHDLDLIQFYAKSKCKSVSSIGELTFFKPQNAPEGSSERCSDCKLKNSCPYSAYRIYIERWKEAGCPKSEWPYTVLVPEPVDEEKLIAAIESGPYGRCVFRCDNNVVDHQAVQILFENGVTATLNMNAFTLHGGRRIGIFGTLGEIMLNDSDITLSVFGQPTRKVAVDLPTEGSDYAHGGGDARLIDSLYDMMEGKATMQTSLEASVESHLIGIKAEESRLLGGKLLDVHPTVY